MTICGTAVRYHGSSGTSRGYLFVLAFECVWGGGLSGFDGHHWGECVGGVVGVVLALSIGCFVSFAWRGD